MTIRTLKLLAAPAVLLSLASCSRDGNPDPSADGQVPMSFVAGIDNVATRATATGFESGDVAGIIPVKNGTVETAQANIAYTCGATGFSATKPYYFQDRGSVTFNAYYPYAGNLPENCEVTIDTRAANQSAETVYGHGWRKNDYLFASAETDVKAPVVSFTGDKAFRHVMSSISFKFKAGTTHGVPNLKLLTGYTLGTLVMDGTFKCSTGTVAPADKAAAETVSVNGITCEETSAEYAAMPLILLPQSVEGGKLTLAAKYNNTDYTASLALAELAAGTRYEFQVTIKNTGLEIGNAEIVDWNAGTPVEGEAILQH